jgi:hypothetical protein
MERTKELRQNAPRKALPTKLLPEKYVFKGATGQAKLARALAARKSQLICMSEVIRNTDLFFCEAIPCNNFISSIRRCTGKLCLARGTHRVKVIKYLNLLPLTLHFVPIFDIRILRLLFSLHEQSWTIPPRFAGWVLDIN